MTDGKEWPQEALDLYRKLAGNDTEGTVDLNSLSSAKRARFIAFCRQQGIDLSHPLQLASKPASPSFTSNDNVSPPSFCSVGIDLIFVKELFPEAPQDLKSDKGISEIFSLREVAYAETKTDPLETLAGIFALKEAVVKTGQVPETLSANFKELEVLHDEKGIPSMNGFAVSISHCNGLAAAMAISNAETQQTALYQGKQVSNAAGDIVSAGEAQSAIEATSPPSKRISFIMALVLVAVAFALYSVYV
jgi:phosphopantetheine--protein transferase-like protein